ncbi:hypothetical protein QW131_24090 [Roseibium salinum]|nr:hypothetical protein [Roseibium salinum]
MPATKTPTARISGSGETAMIAMPEAAARPPRRIGNRGPTTVDSHEPAKVAAR